MQQVNRFLMPLRAAANNLCVATYNNSALLPRQNPLLIKNYVVKRTEWYCVDCDVYCNGHTQFNIHLVSQKHKTKILESREHKLKAIEYDCSNSKAARGPQSIDAQVPVDLPGQAPIKVSPSQVEVDVKREELVIAKPKKYIEGDYSLSKQFDVEAEKYLLPECKRIGKYEKFGYYCSTCDVYMTGQIQLVMHVKGFRHLSHFPEAMPEHMSQKLVRKKQPFNRRRPPMQRTPGRGRRTGLPPLPSTVGLGPNDSIMKRAAHINKETNKMLDYFNFVAQSKCMNNGGGTEMISAMRQPGRNAVMQNGYPYVDNVTLSLAQLNLSDYEQNIPRTESGNSNIGSGQGYRQMPPPVNYVSSTQSEMSSNYPQSYYYPMPMYSYKSMLSMPYKLVENSAEEAESISKFPVKEEPATTNYVYQHPTSGSYTHQQQQGNTEASFSTRPQTPSESDHVSTPVTRFAPVYQPYNSTPIAHYTQTPFRFVTATHPGYHSNHHRIISHAPDAYAAAAYYSSPHHHQY